MRKDFLITAKEAKAVSDLKEDERKFEETLEELNKDIIAAAKDGKYACTFQVFKTRSRYELNERLFKVINECGYNTRLKKDYSNMSIYEIFWDKEPH